MREDLAIVVTTCTSYQDVLDIFFDLFDKNWNDCKYSVYVLGEKNIVSISNVIVIPSDSSISWSKRILSALQSFESEYIMFFMDDYFIKSRVENDYVKSMLRFATDNDADYLRLTNKPYKFLPKFRNNLARIKVKSPYSVNLQMALWKKEFLETILKNIDGSAWKVEEFLMTSALEGVFEGKKLFFTNKDQIKIVNGVIKGKWSRKATRFLKGKKINYNNRRGKLSILITIRNNILYFFTLITPIYLRTKLKKILSKMGFKFATKI